MNPVRVLLVEDGTGDTRATRRAITQCPIRTELTATRCGEEALLRLVHPNTKPDLVILDWNIARNQQERAVATIPVAGHTGRSLQLNLRRGRYQARNRAWSTGVHQKPTDSQKRKDQRSRSVCAVKLMAENLPLCNEATTTGVQHE